jgi:hypothetical protein
MDSNFQFRGEHIPNLTTAESIRDRGAPIAARRIVKLRIVNGKLDEMNILLGKIKFSPLFTVQKTDAVKIVLLPSIDLLFLKGANHRMLPYIMERRKSVLPEWPR